MLFDIAPAEAPRLTGIARLARDAHALETLRRKEYLDLPARTILNRCSNPRMPFAWTINPYRGCEFGCKYCYARYTHDYMGLEGGELFESRIYAKTEAAALLRRDLARNPQGAIAIGTATDPYQPAERRFHVTRAILQVFAGRRGFDLSVTTKSDLAARDAELLSRVAESNRLSVNMTVTTLDRDLARLFEPRAPRPDLRLKAVRRLARAGITVGVFASPVMPALNDGQQALDEIAAAARQAGAAYFGANPLFLKPCAWAVFFPFLEKALPHLAAQYRRRFASRAYLPESYSEEIRERAATARARSGLASPAETRATPHQEEQLALFGGDRTLR